MSETTITNKIKVELSPRSTIVKPNLQDKQEEILENGTITISADDGFDGLNSVNINTNVASVPDWTEIGYADGEIPNSIIDDYNVSKEICDNWDSSVTNLSYKFNNSATLKYMPKVDTSNATNAMRMFGFCSNLEYVPTLDTSNVTNMQQMFQGAKPLPYIDLSHFNTSKVTNMSEMFNNSSVKNIVINGIDTSKVTNARQMFSSCLSLVNIDVGELNLSIVTDITYMFFQCTKLTTESLNSILKMLLTATSLSSGNKTLRYVGLTQTQAETCVTLSNWAALEAAGWTTGY